MSIRSMSQKSFFPPAYRPFFLGFDNIFNDMDTMFGNHLEHKFPFHNLIVEGEDGDLTILQIALAGYNKNDVKITVEGNILTVSSYENKEQDVGDDVGNFKVVHNGITKRSFNRSFKLSPDTVVEDAELKDGMLNITIKRVVPDEKKQKVIPIK